MIVPGKSKPMPVILRCHPEDVALWSDKLAEAQSLGRREFGSIKCIYSAMQVEDIIADPDLGRDELYFDLP